MKKTILTVVILLVLVAALVTGGFFVWKMLDKGDKMFYNYDVTEYIELGDYVGIEYEQLEMEVTEEDVTAYINYALQQKGLQSKKEVTGRPVKKGDIVNIDFEGKKDGVAFNGGTSKGYDLEIGSGSFIPGFEDGLIGANIGQTLDLNLTFPENYGNDELNGAAVVFTVTVNKITETTYPELTDELVKELSNEYTTVKDYRNFVAQEIATYNEETIQYTKENTVWSKVIENAKIIKDIPKDELEFTREMAIAVKDQQYYSQYQMTYEEVLSQQGMSLETESIKKQLDEEAQTIAKEFYVVVAIARDQDLDITEEEYNAALEEYAKKSGYSTAEAYKKTINEKQFYLSAINQKVSAFLMENAVEVKK